VKLVQSIPNSQSAEIFGFLISSKNVPFTELIEAVFNLKVDHKGCPWFGNGTRRRYAAVGVQAAVDC
jgi:hypothetical protein